jgi:hypothetical protein
MRPLAFAGFTALIALFALMNLGGFKDRRAAISLLFAVSLMLFTAACGGGSQAGSTSGTPAGNYQITVTATAGSETQSTTLQLQVN